MIEAQDSALEKGRLLISTLRTVATDVGPIAASQVTNATQHPYAHAVTLAASCPGTIRPKPARDFPRTFWPACALHPVDGAYLGVRAVTRTCTHCASTSQKDG